MVAAATLVNLRPNIMSSNNWKLDAFQLPDTTFHMYLTDYGITTINNVPQNQFLIEAAGADAATCLVNLKAAIEQKLDDLYAAL